MITADSLLLAIDRRRVALAAKIGSFEPVPYSDVATAIGAHKSIFSRLKKGDMPSAKNLDLLLEWIGDEELAHCESCEEHEHADDGTVTEASLEDLEADLEALGGDTEELEEVEDTPEVAEKMVKAVYAVGRLSESEDPETQAAVNRARELMKEGAVGVSVALDLHPDDAELIAEAEEKMAKDGYEKDILEYLPEGFKPRNRIRHTAIVGTPAYADARLELQDDGTVAGIVTFQGEYTGDLRHFDIVDIASSRTPSPILYNRDLEGHEGPTIGFLESFELVDRPPSSHRPTLDSEAITASMKPLEFPALYFAHTVPTKAAPITISEPDSKGYRVISGLAAPKGVCHRSDMPCFTFPTDPDPKLAHFHTGSLLRLDNGQDIRVGALTLGGGHLDPSLAKAGVKASQVGNHRDDANQVFAIVRAFNTRFGLWVNGIIPPDVTEGQIARALACSPSVELWPTGNGKRTLVGIHLVQRPAWPVLASMGAADIAVTSDPIVLASDEELEDEKLEDELSEPLSVSIKELDGKLAELDAKIDKLTEVANAILALTPLEDVEIPE